MTKFASSFKWKAALLVEGCSIQDNIKFPQNIAQKKIHLYSHSSEKVHFPIPDDILLPDKTIARIRFKAKSFLRLERDKEKFQIRNCKTGQTIDVELIYRASFSDINVSKTPISSTCATLGIDLLGVAPSNYCFYFGQKKQCKFCEIFPTFKKEVDFPKSFKSSEIVAKSISLALENDPNFDYLAITTGNIKSYDATFDYFIELGEKLQKSNSFGRVKQTLATLMPPDDLSKIPRLFESGFTKVYFPLEVFDYEHFKSVCPGKNDYGYKNILKALDFALKVFGEGNVYTNFVYGIQSLDSSLDPTTYDPELENSLSLKAVEEMTRKGVIPAFTLYHYGGYNQIGNIPLDIDSTYAFFKSWGQIVHESKLVSEKEEAVLFSQLSLSNTLFNDGYRLAKTEKITWI